MKRLVLAIGCLAALTAGCHNFGPDNTASQTINYDGGRGHFVPADDGKFMNGEPMDMRRN